MFQPVFLPTSLLFVGGLLEIVLARVLSRATKGWLAFLASVLALVAVFALMPAIIHGEVFTASLFDWDAGNAFVYRVDGLSVLFMLMGAGMGSAILLYSSATWSRKRKASRVSTYDAGVHRRLRHAGVLRQFARRLFLLGGGRALLLCAGRLLVQAGAPSTARARC